MSSLTSDLKADSALTLSQAAAGCDFMVRHVEGAACQQLREAGFCEKMKIRKLTDGKNMVCRVCGTRMALSRELAEQVLVTPCGQ